MMAMENCFLPSGVVVGGFHDPFSMVLLPEVSSGYLEDAVVEWGERCKRLRIASSPTSNEAAGTTLVAEEFEELLQLFWGSNIAGNNIYGDFESLFHETNIVSDDKKHCNWEEAKAQHETSSSIVPDTKAQQRKLLLSSLSSENCDCAAITTAGKTRRRKKVVYPFTILKGWGIGEEDEMTLEEINERIMMPPAKAVRHPVGEFAVLPWVADCGGGPGLSGKEVVGFTRIHTKGRGTVTVIRTRG